eukprot:GHVH01003351.1.p1 GENE.GHVH01003351.1~~GHVH01003351.1.p1  ORF type:complete len:666 (+),score=103.10 GHVH01003351.1:120-2117(+)
MSEQSVGEDLLTAREAIALLKAKDEEKRLQSRASFQALRSKFAPEASRNPDRTRRQPLSERISIPEELSVGQVRLLRGDLVRKATCDLLRDVRVANDSQAAPHEADVITPLWADEWVQISPRRGGMRADSRAIRSRSDAANKPGETRQPPTELPGSSSDDVVVTATPSSSSQEAAPCLAVVERSESRSTPSEEGGDLERNLIRYLRPDVEERAHGLVEGLSSSDSDDDSTPIGPAWRQEPGEPYSYCYSDETVNGPAIEQLGNAIIDTADSLATNAIDIGNKLATWWSSLSGVVDQGSSMLQEGTSEVMDLLKYGVNGDEKGLAPEGLSDMRCYYSAKRGIDIPDATGGGRHRLPISFVFSDSDDNERMMVIETLARTERNKESRGGEGAYDPLSASFWANFASKVSDSKTTTSKGALFWGNTLIDTPTDEPEPQGPPASLSTGWFQSRRPHPVSSAVSRKVQFNDFERRLNNHVEYANHHRCSLPPVPTPTRAPRVEFKCRSLPIRQSPSEVDRFDISGGESTRAEDSQGEALSDPMGQKERASSDGALLDDDFFPMSNWRESELPDLMLLKVMILLDLPPYRGNKHTLNVSMKETSPNAARSFCERFRLPTHTYHALACFLLHLEEDADRFPVCIEVSMSDIQRYFNNRDVPDVSEDHTSNNN